MRLGRLNTLFKLLYIYLTFRSLYFSFYVCL
ncbi:hypothetical protein MPL1032_270053 [Mesorhizobium plurifarium]|uniref:Uncharacterized protein n=1 Tax=Mesorhizobium plurifarium TaxID=69974 RepID=A0A0K2W2L2_MESPL|nr:hypothetical protein MPL1032_270053 [Mesorhizobium plurifarium]